MTASTAIPARPSARISTASSLAAALFAGIGGLVAIFALALVLAAAIAPAEIDAHPVARTLVAGAPVLCLVAVVHLAVAAGLLTGVAVARPAAVAVAGAAVALSILELVAIVGGRDPLAAEAADPTRAAQSGLGIVLVITATYVAMLATAAWPRRR